MRLNNKNKIGYFQFLWTVVIMIFIFGISAFLLEYFIYDYLNWSQWLLLLIPIGGVALFYFRGKQIFEYDSDGEVLNFKNRNVVSFLDKSISDEFPKYKLLQFEVIDAVVLKKLYLTIFSKKSSSLILRYDISYLSKKELNDLKISLSRVIKHNQEQKREHIS